jgi:hypothetical protein
LLFNKKSLSEGSGLYIKKVHTWLGGRLKLEIAPTTTAENNCEQGTGK